MTEDLEANNRAVDAVDCCVWLNELFVALLIVGRLVVVLKRIFLGGKLAKWLTTFI